MSLKPNAIREKAESEAMAPGWVRALKPVWIGHHRLCMAGFSKVRWHGGGRVSMFVGQRFPVL
jgi:anti-sigma factor RsiW